MKCLLLVVALCIAVNVSIGEETEHWADRLQKLARNPKARKPSDDPALDDILMKYRLKPGQDTIKLLNRSPYNPLNLTGRIRTDEGIEKWRMKMLARWNKSKGPNSLWNKLLKEQENTMRQRTVDDAFYIALADIGLNIEEYLKALKESCSNVNTLTGQMNAPKAQKITELTATSTKVIDCIERQIKLFDASYDSHEVVGFRMEIPEIAISTLVQNATLIPGPYCDCAAAAVAMATLYRNETCFNDKFNPEYSVFAKSLTDLRDKTRDLLVLLKGGDLTEEHVITKLYRDKLDLFKSPQASQYFGGKLNEFVSGLDARARIPCGEDVIKSVTQAAIELDMEHNIAPCMALMQALAPRFYYYPDDDE